MAYLIHPETKEITTGDATEYPGWVILYRKPVMEGDALTDAVGSREAVEQLQAVPAKHRIAGASAKECRAMNNGEKAVADEVEAAAIKLQIELSRKETIAAEPYLKEINELRSLLGQPEKTADEVAEVKRG